MTTTPTTTIATDLGIDITTIQPHPNNSRAALRDLDTLTKSIAQNGVLQPLTVLPANNDGIHLIIAGHRRYAAALNTELTHLPCVIRDLTEAEVLIAMLTENRQRDDLTVSEEVQALRDINGLENKPTRKDLAQQLGVSTTWLRSRFKLVALPTDLLAKIDNGDITVAQAEAATTLADLGDDAITSFAESRIFNQDPGDAATDYRRTHEAETEAAKLTADYQAKNITVWTNNARPTDARPLTELGLTADDHQDKNCHGVTINVSKFGTAKVTATAYCTTPRSCKPKTGPDSERLADSKRKAAATDRKAALVIAYTAKKPPKTLAAKLAPAAYVHGGVGHDQWALVARCLGDTHDWPNATITAYLDDDGHVNNIAVLLAFAAAESVLSNKHRHDQAHPATDAYLDYLTKHGGWDDPDGWTAKRLKDLA